MTEESVKKEPERVNSEEILDVYEMFRGRLEEENAKLVEKNKNMKNILQTAARKVKTYKNDLEEERTRYDSLLESFNEEKDRRAVSQEKVEHLKRKIGLLEADLSRERLKNKVVEQRLKQALEVAAERRSRAVGWWDSVRNKVRKPRKQDRK